MIDRDFEIEVEEMSKQIFRRTERLLYDYPIHVAVIRAHPARVEATLDQSRQWPPPEGRKEDGPSDGPVVGAYIRVEELSEQYRKSHIIVCMVDAVANTLSDEERKLVEMKYWARVKVGNDIIADSLNMGRGRFYQIRRDIVRKFAIGFGFLRTGEQNVDKT